MEKVDKTSENIEAFADDDMVKIVIKDLVDKINEIVEWINSQ